MKVFKGEKYGPGDTRVTVDGEELCPYNEEARHSPDFEWGYVGSGPYQLAYAILRECTGKEVVAQKLYRIYFDEVVSRLSKSKWKIIESEVCEWLMAHTLQFWKEDSALFDVEVDKWLRSEDRRYESYETIQTMWIEFVYFTQHKGVFGDDPVEHLRYWLEHANQDGSRQGYSSKVWEKAPAEVQKYAGYNFFAEYINPNLVKHVKAELQVSSEKLAELTGYGKDAIGKAASTGIISKPLEVSLNLLLKNKELKEQILEAEKLKSTLKTFLG